MKYRDENLWRSTRVINEKLTLSKYEVNEKILFDCLNIYGFTLNSYDTEFIFILTERQNIVKNLNKKIVRTSGIQIADSHAIQMLNDFHNDREINKE